MANVKKECYRELVKKHWKVFKPGVVEDFESFLNEIDSENLDFSKEKLLEVFESLIDIVDTYAIVIEDLTDDSP